MKIWIQKHRDTIVGIAVLLATLTQFIQASFVQQVENEKDKVLSKSILMGIAAAGFAANSSEILLQRDLVEACRSNNLDICGSSEFLLRESANIRDGIRASVSTSQTELEDAFKTYGDVSKKLDPIIFITNVFFYMLAMIAIMATLTTALPRSRKNSKRRKEEIKQAA